MDSGTDNSPLVVIVGPTGSGKTSLALQLAKQFNGEIICADSRTVYKGMDIGTAKPTPQERKMIPHHLLDIATPDHPITAADFKSLATEVITKIDNKGKVPFLVGGSGLYIDAVIFDFSFRGEPNAALRLELAKLSVAELQEKVIALGLELPENDRNPRHLMRLIETGDVRKTNHVLRSNTLILGIEVEKEELERRLSERLDIMLANGLEEEVIRLVGIYGWHCPPLQTIGYQEFKEYFDGERSLARVKDAILLHSLQYAKRQKTWFKRNKSIHYLYELDESVDLLTTFLNKKI